MTNHTTSPKLRRGEYTDYDMYSGEAVGTIEVWYVDHLDDVYEFDAEADARRALIAVTAAALAGRTVFPCSWEVVRTDGYECDFPGDLYVPCGAPAIAHADDNGWTCLAGHGHRSDVEYYDVDEVAALRDAGHPLAANAALMDGTPL